MKHILLLALCLSSCAITEQETDFPELDSYDAITYFVNRTIEYRRDIDAEGVVEDWKTPAETLADGYGDCEDKALLWLAIVEYNFGVEGYFHIQVLPEGVHAYATAGCNAFSRFERGLEAYSIPYRQALWEAEYVFGAKGR